MMQTCHWEPPAPNERLSPSHWEGYAIRDLTIGHVLALQAQSRGSACYLHDLGSGQRYTYAEVDRLTDRMANSLLSLGIKSGEHVCVMLDNSAQCLLTHFAIGKIGAVSVPMTTAQRGPALAHVLHSANVVAVVTEAACFTNIAEIAEQAAGIRTVIVRDQVASQALPASVSQVRFDSLLQGPQSRPPVKVSFCDPAFTLFTSGTTGPAKGNVFVQAAALMWEQAAPRIWKIGPEDTYYFCVSMAHAAGLLGIAYLMATVGGRVALAQRFSASNFLDDVRRAGATVAMLLGAMGNFVENQPERADDSDNPLRLLLAGPIPKNPDRLRQRFGLDIAQGYGLTDHSSFAKLPLNTPADKLSSVGRIVEPFEVVIVDEQDFPVANGTKGEVLVRSRYPWRTSSGYYNRSADSMAARANDWFHTGDRGYFDADGFLYFVDRKKDAIRRRGENISAFEVERVVLGHPQVAEAAVYAIASEFSEDEVGLSVVIRAGSTLDPVDLTRFCLRNMAAYMVPRFIHVADSLPKTLTQRVEKYKLRQWARENRGLFWDRESVAELKQAR